MPSSATIKRTISPSNSNDILTTFACACLATLNNDSWVMRNMVFSMRVGKGCVSLSHFISTETPVREANCAPYQCSVSTNPRSSSIGGRNSLITPRISWVVCSTNSCDSTKRELTFCDPSLGISVRMMFKLMPSAVNFLPTWSCNSCANRRRSVSSASANRELKTRSRSCC